MATPRNARAYPLQLKAAVPINVGLVTAYDYAGDPANAYAGGDGAPHVGTWALSKDTGAEFPVVTVEPGIIGRDISQGMRTDVRQAYRRIYADKLGIGSADGKGNFTLWHRYRTPAAHTGTTATRTLFTVFDSSGTKIRLIMAESASGYVYFYWEMGAAVAANFIPSSAERTSSPALRVPYNTKVDLHLVRQGPDFYYFINGTQVATLFNDTYVLNNGAWTGIASGQHGFTGTTPSNVIFIDQAFWNRALAWDEVRDHYNDPYAGYVLAYVAPVLTPPAAPTGLIASTPSANAVTFNATPGSDGGAPITEYAVKVYRASDNVVVATGTSATLPVPVSAVPAVPVYGKMVARNSEGTSPESTASNTVTPTDPVVEPPPVDPPPPTGTAVRYDFPASYVIYAAATEPPSGITSVVVTPDAVTVEGGAVRQFNAVVQGTAGFSPDVTWTASDGAINSFGTFTAPAARPVDQQILVRATSVQDPTKWDESLVTIFALVVDEVQSVVVSPSAVTVSGGSQQAFSAVVNGPAAPNQDVDWTSTAGLINEMGVLTSPQAANFEQIITVRATSALDPRKFGEAVVTVAAVPVEEVTGVQVAPAVANLNGGESIQFESEVQGPNSPSQAVTWSTTLGTITQEGVVVAPEAGPREQVGTVTATSDQDPAKSGQGVFVVAAGMMISFTPSTSRQVRILPGRSAYAVGTHWTLGSTGPVGPKDPNSIIDIPFDWSAWLADIGGAKLSKIEFLLGGGLQDEGAVPGIDGGTVLVSGGTPGGVGTVTCRITTASVPSRTEDRTVVLQIRDQ